MYRAQMILVLIDLLKKKTSRWSVGGRLRTAVTSKFACLWVVTSFSLVMRCPFLLLCLCVLEDGWLLDNSEDNQGVKAQAA
jgi:hypothetical protein